MLFVKIMEKMKKTIIQCIYLFFIFTFSYASENYLMKNFNNNSNLGEDSDFKNANYIPSIQVPLNDKSQQKIIKDILLNEKLLFQWSKGLPDKFSGHYWVLMANENKRPILVDIVKIEQKNTIQFPNAVMEIFINKKQEKCDISIKTKIGNFERIENKNNYDLKSKVETKVTVKPKKKVKTWPFILVFDLALILLAISSFDWSGVFEVKIFSDALTAIKEFEIGGFPIFAKILGNVNAFGEWSLTSEMPTLIIISSAFLAFIYGLKLDEFLDGVVEGVKKAIKPAIYMLLVYLVLVIATYNPFQLNITKFFLDMTKGLNVITMSIVAMISSVINIECTYVAQSTLPYVTTVITDSALYPLLAIIFQSIYGLVMLVAPTSVILLGTLSYLGISYGQWLKHIWKLFLQLLIVLVIIFFVVFLI